MEAVRGRTVYGSFIGLSILVRLRVLRCKNSLVECDVPSERSVILPPSGVRCTLRAECDVPSERSVILPPSVGRLSLRAEGDTPSELWQTVYGFFIGLPVLVRLRVLLSQSSLVESFFFCEPSMGLSSVYRFRFAFLFAGGNRPDKERLFWGETRT